MKLLVTGFEPFGGERVNPSWEAAALLPETIDEARIIRVQLPVEYDRAAELLKERIAQERPDAVLCVGQAGGRTCLTPEMVAINWNDAVIADNAGVSYAGEKICPDGPDAYFSTLPVKKMAEEMRRAGVPTCVSYTAGTYVCNNLMYHLLRTLACDYPGVPGGFVHVPYESAQVLDRAKAPSLPLALMTAGLKAAARVIAEELKKGGEL